MTETFGMEHLDEMEEPTSCDGCSDVYDKKDLIHHFKDKFIVCRKCISEYQQLYGVK